MKTTKSLSIIWMLFLFITNCDGGGGSSFSLLSDSDSFQQSAGTVNSKVDILWVIDNSGSMQTSQTNLTSNFSSFISGFVAKDLDYKMAFTTTDAYRGLSGFLNKPACIEFRDRPLDVNCNAVSGQSASGYKILTPLIPGASLIESVFTQNATTGIWGSGNERGLQSMHTVLTHSVNNPYSFLRSDSFLAVIFVSDEIDLSTVAPSYTGAIEQSYVDFLDDLTDPTSALPARRYSMNAITILDTACRDLLNTTFSGRAIGTQYINAAQLTEGISTSLCGNFATDLQTIADGILSLATQFFLSRIPIESTIVVKVNGVVVPKKATNPLADGGWEYVTASNSIKFSGANYIPPKDAQVSVDYDPVAYGQ